ncbi:hypothetical protein HWV62_21276 [Athelia sp. TMB]|nr:hypothetical protein HWV62_21276 [Athelia sp. TMB]
MPSTLELLPPELFASILLQVHPDHLTQTALALIYALPGAPIAGYQLLTHIRITNPKQAVGLDLRLRKHREDIPRIKDFKLKAWTVDADVVCNLINLLPKLTNFTLFIGPNFAPEHLEEIFTGHIEEGAYFDSTLRKLAQWPPSNDKPLLALSIVQDPIPEVAQKERFAQPLVFFRLDPLSELVCSKYLQSLQSFRLRIPGRQFVRYICAQPGVLSHVELLDVSTSMIAESEVETLLGQFTRLRHLILDNCNMKRLDLLDGEWAALGKSCAIAGHRRAKDREKKLREWLEAHTPQANPDEQVIQVVDAIPARRARRGRRGVAVATISLREREEPALRPSGPSRINPNVPKIRILPSPPSLASLAITTTSYFAQQSRQDAIRADFERGWSEGLAQLNAIRSRLRQSWNNGIRVVKFSDDGSLSEDGLDGLVDVETINMSDDMALGDAPLLCLAGPGRKDGHVEGCGHALGWNIWDDDL